MNHAEAIQAMATERYILDELSPEQRDAFEEHFFECPECALDVRTVAAFVEEAKAQLPMLTTAEAASAAKAPASTPKRPFWSFWSWLSILSSPSFNVPVFAALLLVVGYQNLVTYPTLRVAASESRLAPTVFLHTGARGAGHTAVEVDRRQGTALLVDVPQQSGFGSFVYELRDPEGKLAVSVTAAKDGMQSDGTLSLAIPAAGLRDGTYTLTILGVAANGDRTEIDRNLLDFHLRN